MHYSNIEKGIFLSRPNRFLAHVVVDGKEVIDVYKRQGYALEDYYGEEWEKRYFDCVADHRISKRVIPIKELIRLIIKSAVETGTPFTFNRDHVNKMNPNGHKGKMCIRDRHYMEEKALNI